jgi:hypothetical protein
MLPFLFVKKEVLHKRHVFETNLVLGLNSPGLLLLASTKGTSSKVCNVLFC